MAYTITEDGQGRFLTRTDADGTVWHIPFDEGNSDYRAYLEWLAEGNTPEPWPPAE